MEATLSALFFFLGISASTVLISAAGNNNYNTHVNNRPGIGPIPGNGRRPFSTGPNGHRVQGHNFNQRPPPHSLNQRPPPHSLNQRPSPHNLNQRPPPHNLNQRPPPHGLSNHNQHRNPHFFYHPPARHNGGPNTHVRTTTESSHTQKGSIPTVELPKGLSKYRSQYKKWWKVFHADLTNCGTQPGVSSLFRVIGGRISSIKSWPWMVSMYSTLIQQPWCAGTLIAKDWVVTAAHCFNL